MKNIFLFTILFLGLILSSCGDDNDTIDFDYHTHIHAPNTDDKHVGDTLDIEVEFDSQTGEIVHNIAVKITNDLDNTVVAYDYEEHVHADEMYTHTASIVLDSTNNVTAHSDWTLEAKVYGPDGVGEEVETVMFHVHPE